VLDIGCGLGYQALDIQRQSGARVTGIDVIYYLDSDFSCKIFDGIHIPYSDKFFNVSYLSYVLHHAVKPMKLLAEALRVSRKRVLIIEDTPRNFFDRTLDAYHGWSFNKFYGLQHASAFRTQKEWEQIFEKSRVKSFQAIPFGRFNREIYFPISRTLFIIDR